MKSKEIYAYGETPLKTYQTIVSACEIKSSDCWLELGSGRGVGCFWVAHLVRCQVIGVEWVPQFIRIAKLIKTLFRVKNVTFQLENIAEADFSKATVVYLYLYDAPDLVKMEKLPLGAKVISVSAPLESPFLTVKKSFYVYYPWGKTRAYLSERMPCK